MSNKNVGIKRKFFIYLFWWNSKFCLKSSIKLRIYSKSTIVLQHWSQTRWLPKERIWCTNFHLSAGISLRPLFAKPNWFSIKWIPQELIGLAFFPGLLSSIFHNTFHAWNRLWPLKKYNRRWSQKNIKTFESYLHI